MGEKRKKNNHVAAKMATDIIEVMMDAVVITDLEGRVTQFNKALMESFGSVFTFTLNYEEVKK